MTTKILNCIVVGIVIAALSACTRGVHSPSGFRLPDNGDGVRGQTAFVELKCTGCHTVDGIELPEPTETPVIGLGGAMRDIRTDGYLVTSIIHPSHRLGHFPKSKTTVDGETRMPDYAQSMTVRQLIDTVAFLRPRYRFEPPPTVY